VSPLVTVPAVAVYVPPFTRYSPPLAETETGPVMPVIVTMFDCCTLLAAAPVTSVKAKAAGVMSCATVVLVKVSDTLPIVRVVLVAVANDAEAVCCSCTVWPSSTVPAAVVKAPVPMR